MSSLNGSLCSNPKMQIWRRFCCHSQSFLPPPRPREAHLWLLFPDEVNRQSLTCSYESILPFEERSLLHQSKNEKVQQEYLLTRILARTLIARYAGGLVDPAALNFERGKHGKPKIVWPTLSMDGIMLKPPNISFNISHTRGLIVCAITGASQVGIDVEEKDRVTCTDLIRLARRKFSKIEANQLEELNDLEARKRHFLQLWTLKESYGKATGHGITGTTLQDAAFTFDEVSSALKFEEYLTGIPACSQAVYIKPRILNQQSLWQFILLRLTNLYNTSLCIRKDGSIGGPFHVQIMKTIPLVQDEPFQEAFVLGWST